MAIKRYVPGCLYTLIALTGIGIAAIIVISKPLPQGKEGPEAEAFADSVLAVMHCDTWDRLRFVSWTYEGKHHYFWDKFYNLVELRYGKMRILLNANAIDGIVWKNGVRLRGERKRKYINLAWKYWCDEGFWLNPICRLRDKGTVRQLVTLGPHEQGLLVTYPEDSVSPGNSFLWITDEDYKPLRWKMWVHILPVRGISATWEGWEDLGGVPVSTRHRIGPFCIEIEDLCTGQDHSDFGLDRDPFIDFVPE